MFTNTLILISALAASALSMSVPMEGKRAVSAQSSIQGVQWKVSNFTRPCVGNICTYSFTISVIPSAGPGVDIPCLYNDTNTTPPVSTTPQNHSYSALYCSTSTTTSSTGTTTTTNSPWQINWGYNANGDFAVMTVVDTSKGQDAFFGWNGITDTTAFKDQGPNTVYAVGTFN